MFTAATDAAPAVTEPEINDETEATLLISKRVTPPALTVGASSGAAGTWEFTDAVLLQQKRDEIIQAMSLHVGAALIKKTRALYWSADHTKRVVCTISKRYTKRASHPYWYAFHLQWNDFLGEGEEGYFVLGCMDLSVAFAIPRKVIHDILPDLNTTEAERGTYWHIHVVQDAAGNFELFVPKRSTNMSISAYTLNLSGTKA
jgi:hypothetical protein